MASSPITLDNLISYLTTLHPRADPLENLSDAVVLSQTIEEQSDALIGHFVDQARRSGASWSQIGASMGVSKQAVQKRFVPRWNGTDPVTESQMFSRFTDRSRHVMAVAALIAAKAGSRTIDASHLAVGLSAEPLGVAARVVHSAGVTDDQLFAAFELQPVAEATDSDVAALRSLHFTEAGTEVLLGTLKSALRLGHNYIGTEHLLLGILTAEGDAARTLAQLGLTIDLVEAEVIKEIAKLQAKWRTA